MVDPQNQFCDRRRARIDFEPQKLMWIDAVRTESAQGLLAAKVEQRFQQMARALWKLMSRYQADPRCLHRR
jgi:hypothetical protein